MSSQSIEISDHQVLRSAMLGTVIGITYESLEVSLIIYILTLTSSCGLVLRFPCSLYLSGILMNLIYLSRGLYTMFKTHTVNFRSGRLFLKLRQTSIIIYWATVIIISSAIFRNQECIEQTPGQIAIVLDAIALFVAAAETLAEVYDALKKSKESDKVDDVDQRVVSMRVKYAGENITCAICIGDIMTNSDVIQLKCSEKHVFHENCIQDWFRERSICPICRQSI